MINERLSAFSKTAGPGILFACTAIGVSHLVQSTRAGADFGLMIVGFVILVNLLKYPFFEYGSRYANATQTSIIDGYSQLGKPALWLYFLLTSSFNVFRNRSCRICYCRDFLRIFLALIFLESGP